MAHIFELTNVNCKQFEEWSNRSQWLLTFCNKYEQNVDRFYQQTAEKDLLVVSAVNHWSTS